MNFFARLRKLDTKRRNNKKRPERIALEAAISDLTPDDIAIDCGANVGSVAILLAQTGAQVYAFEPHPSAFKELEKKLEPFPHAKAIQACITTEPGPVNLYLHKWDNDDPVYWSTGSSIVSGKRNVDEDKHVTVEGVILTDFIQQLGKPIKILKMDIEGAEVAVLNQLLDHGLHQQIGQGFVEVHGIQIPKLEEPTNRLKERLETMGAKQFRLDWR